MRLQNIYDSIEPAIMSKVNDSIESNDAYFSFGVMSTGVKAQIDRGLTPFWESTRDSLSQYCKGAKIDWIFCDLGSGISNSESVAGGSSLNDRASYSGFQDARGIASAGEESRIYGSYGMGGPILRGLL